MGPIAEFSYGGLELLGWGLQILLLAAVRVGGPIRVPKPSLSFCLLVLAFCWVLRLAYLFALASGGFLYWIGDDPLRWLTAWQWMQGSGRGSMPPGTWMPGTYYLHGLAMGLSAGPLHASKLVSTTYSAMPLVGLFVFAQAVFRQRALSAACVVFLAPFWIDILLSGGTMAEMPSTGAMLAGAGALILALRTPLGRRRTRLFLGAAAGFAIGTMFHAVAWIELSGILLFVLPVFLRETHGSLATRFASWVAFCALSTSYCFVWAIDVWAKTGSPLTPFREASDIFIFKIGGPTRVLELLGQIVTPAEVAIVGLAALSVVAFFGLRLARADESGRFLGRFDVTRLATARWASAGAAVVLCALAYRVIDAWFGSLPVRQHELFTTNLAIFPVSLLYCSFYYLPLLGYGLIASLIGPRERPLQPRLVLACIAFVFAIFVATSLNGGANLSPFRTVLTLSTALVPFALAPIFDRRSAGAGPASMAAWTSIAVALLVLFHGISANHTRIFSELPVPSILRPREPLVIRKSADMYAIGAWIRAELRQPGYLSEQNLALPFELALEKDVAGIKQTVIEYQVGDPARFSRPERILPSTRARRPQAEILAGLAPNQILIADYEFDAPGLRLIIRLGQFWIYESVAP